MADISLSTNYLNIAQQSAGSQAASRLESLGKKDFSGADDKELMDACKEFESYFLEMVMKEVTKGLDFTGGASGSGNGTLLEYYKDKTISSLAKESTEQSSLGLAQQMYEQMKRSANTVTMDEILAHQAELRGEAKEEPEESSKEESIAETENVSAAEPV